MANINAFQTPPRSTVDLLDIFWRRRQVIIWCAAIVILVGVAYSFLAAPVYQSSADVLVVQKRPQAVTGASQYEIGFQDYLATHLAIIASPLIVERAIQAADLQSLQCFANLEDPEEDLVDAILGDLEVTGGSRDLGDDADSIMTLTFYSSIPEDCPIVVQALLESYETFHDEVYRGMSGSTVELIEQARDLLNHDIASQETAYGTFRQQSPLVARGTDEVNPLQDRLTSIEQRRSELLLRRADIERQMMALEQARQDGSDYQQLVAIVSELRQQTVADNGLPNLSTTLENQLIQLVDDEQRLLEHYGPNHPHVTMIRQRMAATRRFFALPTPAHLDESDSSEITQVALDGPNSVEAYKEYLKQELKRLEIAENLMSDIYDREHENAKEHSVFQLIDERFRRGIERSEGLYEVVVNRLQEASLVKDFGGFETRVIAPPRLGTKVAPEKKIVLPVAAFAGLALGCLLALGVDLSDGRFRSVGQVQEEFQLPVVGQIPVISKAPVSIVDQTAGSKLDTLLSSHYQPDAPASESFRRLRTELIVNTSIRVVQVMGVSPGDGASTIAANLAVTLAGTGKQVLLIDADLGHQRQSRIFGIGQRQSGLATILGADAEPSDVICQTEIEHLSVLPSGALPAGSRELFHSPIMGEMLAMLRNSYDYILIDSEPVSLTLDPCLIAAHTDGMLLAVKLTRDSRQRTSQALQMLKRLHVNLFGIVVNQVDISLRNYSYIQSSDRLRTSASTAAY